MGQKNVNASIYIFYVFKYFVYLKNNEGLFKVRV